MRIPADLDVSDEIVDSFVKSVRKTYAEAPEPEPIEEIELDDSDDFLTKFRRQRILSKIRTYNEKTWKHAADQTVKDIIRKLPWSPGRMSCHDVVRHAFVGE